MPLVVEYLGRPEVAASGYLLDGFPRSADQAEVLLDAKLQSLLVNPAPRPICTAIISFAGKARVLMMVCGCQVLRLEVPDELIIERCEGRRYLSPSSYPFALPARLIACLCEHRMDPETGEIYHMKYSPPEDEAVAERLVQRDDDRAGMPTTPRSPFDTRLVTMNAFMV